MAITLVDKLDAIIEQIGTTGHADLLRLTVLKRWFGQPERLAAFAAWVASRAASRGTRKGRGAELLAEAQDLLARHEATGTLDRAAAQDLYRRLQAFHDVYTRSQWGLVRMIDEPNIVMVEEALAILLLHTDSPPHGYRLAADYCQHYDPHHGTGLNGPSVRRLREIVDFVRRREAEEAATGAPSETTGRRQR